MIYLISGIFFAVVSVFDSHYDYDVYTWLWLLNSIVFTIIGYAEAKNEHN